MIKLIACSWGKKKSFDQNGYSTLLSKPKRVPDTSAARCSKPKQAVPVLIHHAFLFDGRGYSLVFRACYLFPLAVTYPTIVIMSHHQLPQIAEPHAGERVRMVKKSGKLSRCIYYIIIPTCIYFQRAFDSAILDSASQSKRGRKGRVRVPPPYHHKFHREYYYTVDRVKTSYTRCL